MWVGPEPLGSVVSVEAVAAPDAPIDSATAVTPMSTSDVEQALNNLKEALDLFFEDTAVPDEIEPPIIASVELSA